MNNLFSIIALLLCLYPQKLEELLIVIIERGISGEVEIGLKDILHFKDIKTIYYVFFFGNIL
jgi:hypothetical protein